MQVLALYDNGVLFNAILMLGVPALYNGPDLPDATFTRPKNSTSNLFDEEIISNFSIDELNTHINRIDDKANFNLWNLVNLTSNVSNLFFPASDNETFVEIESQCASYYNPLYLYIPIVYPVALISQTGSIWTTCLITAERYLAICHPLRALTLSTKSRAIWALTVLSIGSLIYNAPRFAEFEIITLYDGSYAITVTAFRQNKLYYWLYYICANLTLIYVLPLLSLSILNTQIYLVSRKRKYKVTCINT